MLNVSGLNVSGRRGARSSRGFTIVEMSVAASISALVMAMVYSFYSGAALSSGKAADQSEAMRSALLAAEVIRRDVVRATLADPDHDLGIPDSGTALDEHHLTAVGADLASWSYERLSFTLKGIDGAKGVFRLNRQSEREKGTVPGCLISGLQCRLLPEGTLSPRQTFLQLTVAGAGSVTPHATFVCSTLVPVTPWYRPALYRLDLTTGVRVQ